MEKQLKIQCPFCHAAAPCNPPVSQKHRDGYVVRCKHCNAMGPMGKTRDQAWSYWNANRRTFNNVWGGTL